MAAIAGTFACFFDPDKSTSGQRFFTALVEQLRPQTAEELGEAAAVLFNVSAPLNELLKARLRGQIVVLRLDGIYHDRLSAAFVASFRSVILRALFRVAFDLRLLVPPLTRLANLINRNYGALARALLAQRIVYQSQFCRRSWRGYLPRKPATVIVNGFQWSGDTPLRTPSDRIELVSAYDGWKPAKRIDELLEFVRWANESGRAALRLTLLGFTGAFPSTWSASARDLIGRSEFVRTTPRFSAIDAVMGDVFAASHAYITFTYRDPCPNVVVEAMAFGLPVVATRSGGLPDIVGDAGELVPLSDESEPEFCASRYESDFPAVDYGAVLKAVQAVVANQGEYRQRVRRRFASELDIAVVARRYVEVLR